MKIDIDLVTQIISQVAQEVIVPRFQKLAQAEIMEKSPGDLVTIADIEAEIKLTEQLCGLIPNAKVVGEEAVSKDASILELLNSDDPVWIIDPVDGTRNFANGDDLFGSIVCLVKGGEILAGWIHDPIRNRTAVAEQGAGAFMSSQKLHVKDYDNLEEMTVSIDNSHRKFLESHPDTPDEGAPDITGRQGAAAHDYISLACGEFHCAQYRRLNAWDHAAGVLLHREAGGYDQMIATKKPYEPIVYENNKLLLTPSKDVWEEAYQFLNPTRDTIS